MLNRNVLLTLFVISQFSGIRAAAARNGFSIEPRIIRGGDADLDSTKYQVSIRLRSDEDEKFGSGIDCGGSLISNNLVLTAAHCLLDDSDNITFGYKEDWVVVMGNLNRTERNKNTLVFDILDAVVGDLTNDNDADIGLLLLNGTVPDNHPTVKPITLNDGPVAKDTLCHATGWGLNENDIYPEMLQVVDLPIIDIQECRDKTTHGQIVHEGMICAGYLTGGRSACNGDSGGPLVCNGIQVGITSWSKKCALPLKPTVFTNVASYATWISEEADNINGTPPQFAKM